MTGSDAGIDDYDTAIERLDEAARMAEEIGDRAALGLVSSHRAHFHWRHKLMVDCAAEYERACELLESAGEAYALAQARTWRVLALVALGRFTEAATMVEGLDAYCERVGDFGSVFGARRARAFMEVTTTGDLTRWQEFAAADLAFLEGVGSRWTANSHSYVALGHFWCGRWDEALPHARRALELELDDSWAGADETPLLLLLAYRREHDALRALIAERRRYLPQAGVVNRAGAWELLPAVVEALAVIGDHDEAAALYPIALEAVERGAPIHYSVKSLPATTAGIAATCARQWSTAEEHFRVAVHQADELPNRIEQPEARRWWATMLLERRAPEDVSRARALLAESVRLYDEIGMPRHREIATKLRAQA
jgi:tetratricopeptide (TPR) repeat protein